MSRTDLENCQSIALKKLKSITDNEYFVYSLDLEKYNNRFERIEIDEKIYTEIRQFIQRKIRSYLLGVERTPR